MSRVAILYVRNVMARFRAGQICAGEAAEELELRRSRFDRLWSQYLRAVAGHCQEEWSRTFREGTIGRSLSAEVGRDARVPIDAQRVTVLPA